MYVPKRADWNTLRKNFGPRDFLIRIVSCTLVLILAYGIGAKTPRAREDREWILEFSVVMMLFFTVIHTLSFLPAYLFNSPAQVIEGARGLGRYAYGNFREIHYCAAALVFVIILWPIMTFFLLIKDGFNPYSELTNYEKKINGGFNASLLHLSRIVLHLYLAVLVFYLFVCFMAQMLLRSMQTPKGKYTHLVLKVRDWPFSSFFFQQGDLFDCGLCLHAFWEGEQAVQLQCAKSHAFHAACLKEYVENNGKCCIYCSSPI